MECVLHYGFIHHTSTAFLRGKDMLIHLPFHIILTTFVSLHYFCLSTSVHPEIKTYALPFQAACPIDQANYRLHAMASYKSMRPPFPLLARLNWSLRERVSECPELQKATTPLHDRMQSECSSNLRYAQFEVLSHIYILWYDRVKHKCWAQYQKCCFCPKYIFSLIFLHISILNKNIG